jgi:hypothetical protein
VAAGRALRAVLPPYDVPLDLAAGSFGQFLHKFHDCLCLCAFPLYFQAEAQDVQQFQYGFK